MKVRNGFVSNSSSSSFVIRGVSVSFKEAVKMFKVNLKSETFVESEERGDYWFDTFADEVYKQFPKKSKLEIHTTAYSDSMTGYDNEDPKEHPVVIGYDIGEICQNALQEVPTIKEAKEKELLRELNELPFKNLIHDHDLKTFAQFSPGM
jgi:hypothetical protein